MKMKPMNLVRKAKTGRELNLTLFYRRFPILSALSQLYEIKDEKQRGVFFRSEDIEQIKSYEKQNSDDPYAHEKAMVQNACCDSSRPLCLYDMTQKAVMLDYLPLSMPDLGDNLINDNYFYPQEVKDPHSQPIKFKK